ncbi:MAG: hypothetical protein K8F54_09610 [Altibacter sp.]|uniref:hypothetical protein n=1 Tax=Altibacter sp. TaxID=2024823 RepID=UPI001D2B27E9|nr:hypothetical protein [Altibacter sp.]MBZ0327846.1 hypothetical protein [Altibacter sp.]
MDKPYKNEELFTKKLVKEAGLSKPSVDFTMRVMTEVTRRKVTQSVYQPLISNRTWGVLAVVLTILLVVIIAFPLGDDAIFGALHLDTYLNFSMRPLKLSKTVVYAIGFTALFLVQIPFLKHYLGKQYR